MHPAAASARSAGIPISSGATRRAQSTSLPPSKRAFSRRLHRCANQAAASCTRPAASCPRRTMQSSTAFWQRIPSSRCATLEPSLPAPISRSTGACCGSIRTGTAVTASLPRCSSAGKHSSRRDDSKLAAMVAPLQLDRVQQVLSTPAGWIELVLVLVCFGVAWSVDRRVRLRGDPGSHISKIGAGSVNRLVFPLTALVLLLLARGIFQHWQAPLFLPIAIPLAIALALIRLLVYSLHNIFGSGHWLPTSERAISFAIFGALLLYYAGVLQLIGDALGDVRFQVGKSEVNLLDLGRDALVLVIAL